MSNLNGCDIARENIELNAELSNDLKNIAEAFDPDDAFDDFHLLLLDFGLSLDGFSEIEDVFHIVKMIDDADVGYSGWYTIVDSPIPCGLYGDFRQDDICHVWVSDIEMCISKNQREALEQRIKYAKLKWREEQHIVQYQVATKSKNIWNEGCNFIHDRNFLNNKFSGNVKLSLSEDLYFGWSIIPILDQNDDIVNLRFISETEECFLTPDGKSNGCFSIIQGGLDEIYIVEGYSEACTLSATTGKTCLITWKADNMMAVAKIIRAKYPSSTLNIVGDIDPGTVKLCRGVKDD